MLTRSVLDEPEGSSWLRLGTVIDVAPEVAPEHVSEMIEDCLQRRPFTVEDAVRRLAEPDLAGHRGAELLRRAIDQIG